MHGLISLQSLIALQSLPCQGFLGGRGGGGGGGELCVCVWSFVFLGGKLQRSKSLFCLYGGGGGAVGFCWVFFFLGGGGGSFPCASNLGLIPACFATVIRVQKRGKQVDIRICSKQKGDTGMGVVIKVTSYVQRENIGGRM